MLCLWTILKELCRTHRSWYEELRQWLFDLPFTLLVMHLQSGCLLVFIAVSCVYVYMYHKAIMIKFVLESVLRLTFILYLMCLSGFSFFSFLSTLYTVFQFQFCWAVSTLSHSEAFHGLGKTVISIIAINLRRYVWQLIPATCIVLVGVVWKGQC